MSLLAPMVIRTVAREDSTMSTNTFHNTGERTNSCITDHTQLPAWLIQYDAAEVAEVKSDWDAGRNDDVVHPAINRHTDRIEWDDLIFVWRAGAGNKAGIVGLGLAGNIDAREHAKNYQDPEGPRALRDTLDVQLVWFTDQPVLTRTDLKKNAAFADFELFRMPNRPNAFAVSDAQRDFIIARLQEVIGK